ncbi:MAG: 50S ribosomal protein L29 [bacterium]|nr:50S ribosomal protein L29 [bacterium]
MKGKKIFLTDLNEKSIKELVELRRKLRDEQHALKIKHTMRAVTNTSEITQLHKKIARVSTVLTSKIKENNGGNRK